MHGKLDMSDYLDEMEITREILVTGVTEIVVGTLVDTQGGEGGRVAVLQGATGGGEWQWTSADLDSTSTNVLDVEVGNLDADSNLEIVVARDRLWVLEKGSQTPHRRGSRQLRLRFRR